MRDHVNRLAAKGLLTPSSKRRLDFVIAFVPGDPFLGAAFEKDPSFRIRHRQEVLITTPTTLIALLKAVAYGWRQESVEENAQKISELGKELYERVGVMASHFKGVGDALDKAVRAYNDTVGALESRVLVTTRKFRDLQAAGVKEMPEPEVVDRAVRAIQAPELTRTAGGE